MEQKQNSRLLPSLLLLLVAVIWGGGFIVTDAIVKTGLPPSMVVALRFFIPAVMMAFIYKKELLTASPPEFLYGAGAGALLFAAFVLQTHGISRTTPANSAFLTSTNVIMVPFLSLFIFKQRLDLKSVVCAFTCFAGAAILSWSPEMGITFNLGDCLTLGCALVFALHYAYLGKFAGMSKSAGLLCCVQLFFTALFSFLYFLAAERELFSFSMLSGSIWNLLYLGLFSTGFCYLVQTWAQARFSPSGTAIILSLEGFFGSLFSVLMGLDEPTATFVAGGAVILISVMAVQLDPRDLKRLFGGR